MKYRETFRIVGTEEEARAFCDKINAEHSAYMRAKHPATFTAWAGRDGSSGFICWFMSL